MKIMLTLLTALLGASLTTLTAAEPPGAARPSPTVSEAAPATDSAADLDRYRLDPLPEPLAKVRGIHPRLFLDAEGVIALKQRVATTHNDLWRHVKASADTAVKKGPQPYSTKRAAGRPLTSDDQLWQREMGNAMPQLAMTWLITGDKRYLNAARDYALASCSYPTWGPKRSDGLDLPAGHQLFGLALIYDWCYSDLDEQTRQTIRQTLIRRGETVFQAAATGKIWWSQKYMQNHLQVNATGLGTAGLAIFDEHEPARRWVALVADKMKRITEAYGPDGASHEGVGYWSYGAEFMLKYMDLSRTLLGVDLYKGTPWWQQTAAYRLYLSLPRNGWTPGNTIVDIGDSPRADYYGPDHILRRLASEYHDGQAQWLAQELDKDKATVQSANWLNLLWYDSSISPVAPADARALPTFHHFADLGIVSSRSDWSGNESLVTFKCGPFLGHDAENKFNYDAGAGHVHPDANHFTVFGGGEWLIRDDGYMVKQTSYHNSLIVDGKGQIGGGKPYYDGTAAIKAKATAKILWAKSEPAMDQFAGDATRAYPPELGIQRFIRRIAFIKPNVLIVADNIELAGSHEMELLFHPEQPTVQEAAANDRFISTSGKNKLLLTLLTDAGVSASISTVKAQMSHGGAPTPMQAISLKKTACQWQNVVAISWSDKAENPPQVQMRRDGTQLIFTLDNKVVLTLPMDVREGK